MLKSTREKILGCKDGSNRYATIFLDKNHPEDLISKVVDEISTELGNNSGE